MNSRILAADVPAHVGERVTIAGWLHRRRALKSVTFLIVRDRSGLTQVVLRSPANGDATQAGPAQTNAAQAGTPQAGTPQAGTPQAGMAQAGTPQAGMAQADTPQAGAAEADTPQAGMAQADTPQASRARAGGMAETDALPEETVIMVDGFVTASPQAPGGAEITDPVITSLSGPAEPPPFDLYRPAITAALPAILDHAPTTLRHPRLRAGFEIAAASVAGFRTALDDLGFTEVHTPKIVGSATESGATTFGIDYFGQPAYLAQSPQFYKQALVGMFERVYEVGPVFRAEPHDTARHLAQYTSLDAELGFITDHQDVMSVLRDTIAGMLAAVGERARSAVDLLGLALPAVPGQIPQLHFRDAQELIAAKSGRDPRGEPDLSPADERWLCEWAAREHGSEFLFVTGYPMAKRPFYTHPDPARPGYSNGFDLLFRGLELVTGGQRLHKHADYLAALAARGEDPRPYSGYLQVFEHGMPPHGGFAIGLERWTARLVGAANIRQVTLFPRDLHRLSP